MSGRRWGLLLGLAVLAGSAAGSAAGANAGHDTGRAVRVEISHFAFSPQTLTVPAGTRVVWTNRDEEPHVVTSAGTQFAPSLALDTGDSYAVTFAKPGTYAYFCSIHPMMVGTIIVQ